LPLYPGRCPGLRASALTGRAAYRSFTFALPFGQRFSIPLRAGDRWFRACCLKGAFGTFGPYLNHL